MSGQKQNSTLGENDAVVAPSEGLPGLSASELEVLKLLWESAPLTVKQVQARVGASGRDWAYTTVLTLLQRLLQKGYVTSDTRTHAHQFVPKVTRDEVLGTRLREVADQLYDGAASPLLLHLVQHQTFTADEIRGFRALLDQLAAEAPQPPPSKSKTPRTHSGRDQ